MTRAPASLAVLCGLALAGCAAPAQPVAITESSIPAADPLYLPDRVIPGRLEYAPDGTIFAPVLTERFPYPTEA
jgi:hypothetical protein